MRIIGQLRRRTAVGTVCVALIAAAAGVAGAQPPDASPEAQQKAYWQTLHHDIVERIRDASERLEQARGTYARVRHHRKLQDQGKLDVATEIAAAEADLRAAHAELEAFPDGARRGGALPGWLRELEDEEAGLHRLGDPPRSPEEHRALAERLRSRAARYRVQAEAHRSMGLAYRGTRMRNAEEMRAHCDEIARLDVELARQLERLAEGHEAAAEEP